MSVIQVLDATPLEGEISIQGSKNAVLPMAAAALLHRGITVLTNVPVIRDVACMRWTYWSIWEPDAATKATALSSTPAISPGPVFRKHM